jgi:hypothetical protein
MRIRKGLIKRIHVDRRILGNNVRLGKRKPPVTIQVTGGSIKARWAYVHGPSKMVYGKKPLKCGARVWVETTALVSYA